MPKIAFEVSKLAIAYAMQLRGLRNFEIRGKEWIRLLERVYDETEELLVKEISSGLEVECVEAERLRKIIEKEWRSQEENVLCWLEELTKVDFKKPTVKICVVPLAAGLTPFKNVPLIIIGKIRKGWGYPETIGHELAHVLFNQNFNFEGDFEHPYVQLIEEEIAVRLGARPKYFDYEVPAFAEWVFKAQQREKAWRHYLDHIAEFNDISQFIRQNGETTQE